MKNKRLLTITLMILLAPVLALSQKVESNNKKDHFKIKDPDNFMLAKNALESRKWVFESRLKSTNEAVKPEYASYKTSQIVKNGDSCYLELPGTYFRNVNNEYSIWCKTERIGTSSDKRGRIKEQMSIFYNSKINANVIIYLIGNGSGATVDIEGAKSSLHYSGRIIPLSDSEYAKIILK